MPEHIFIYRDGVGDSMRQMVIDEELNQLHKIVAEEYTEFAKQKWLAEAKAEGKEEEPMPELKYKSPEITLIIVNKRVR
jgi:hypothetical protein